MSTTSLRNPFVYYQLQTRDLKKAREFYAGLFAWRFDERQTPAGPYIEIDADVDSSGGMVGLRNETNQSQWIPYVFVTDIVATTVKAHELGASIVHAPTQLPDNTWFCILTDPTGATFALHQPATPS